MLATTSVVMGDFFESIGNSFLGETWFMVLMGLLLVGLVVVYFLVRNRKSDDE